MKTLDFKNWQRIEGVENLASPEEDSGFRGLRSFYVPFEKAVELVDDGQVERSFEEAYQTNGEVEPRNHN